MRLDVNVEIDMTAEELVSKMRVNDIAKLLSAVAAKLDGDNIDRLYCITEFESGMTEDGARFLAEIITQRFTKKK